MRKRWIGYLLALFALLWARLPGPSAQDEPKPSSKFRVKRRGEIIEISTKAAKLPWPSEQITEIRMREVELQRDGWYPVKGASLLQSEVEVRFTSPDIAELHNLDSKVRERLLSGTGYHAIMTRKKMEKGQFDKQEKMLVEGKGRGIWRILQRR